MSGRGQGAGKGGKTKEGVLTMSLKTIELQHLICGQFILGTVT